MKAAEALGRLGCYEAIPILEELTKDSFSIVRDTAEQTGLPWSDRRRNVRGAFRCARSIPGGTVAVVDDVMTTGATLDEIASTLKRAGAVRVVNWVVARTYV